MIITIYDSRGGLQEINKTYEEPIGVIVTIMISLFQTKV